MNQPSSPPVFRKCKDALATDVDSDNAERTELVILHMRTKRYYVLNGTGRAIWQFLDLEPTAEEIAERLCESYDLTLAQARGSVDRLLAELVKEELAESSIPDL